MKKTQQKQTKETKQRDGNYVTWLLPLESCNVIRQTLEADSRSTAFDPELRKQIAAALDSIEVL